MRWAVVRPRASLCAARLRLGMAKLDVGRDGDRAGLAAGLHPAPARPAQQRLAHTCAAKAARSRLTAPRFIINEAATVASATTATTIVQIALISGFTPRRTCE